MLGVEKGLELLDLGLKGFEALFDLLAPVGVGWRAGFCGAELVLRAPSEEMTESFDAAATASGDAFDEGTVRVVDEAGENFFDFGKIVEGVEAVGALFEFACGLRSAQEKDGEDGPLSIGEFEHVVELVLVFGGAAAEDFGDEVLFGKGAKGVFDFVAGVVGDGVA